MRPNICPLCEHVIETQGGHVCTVAEILCVMEPAGTSLTRRSSLSRSFNSRCSNSSASSKMSKCRVTWKEDEGIDEAEAALSEQLEFETQDDESECASPTVRPKRKKGERVRTRCPLAGRVCKKEVPSDSPGRITGVSDELYEVTTDEGVVLHAEPQDLIHFGFLPVKTPVLTAAPLTLRSEDLTLQYPIGTRARILSHNLETGKVYLKFHAGPCCDLAPEHIVPCPPSDRKQGSSFFSRLLGGKRSQEDVLSMSSPPPPYVPPTPPQKNERAAAMAGVSLGVPAVAVKPAEGATPSPGVETASPSPTTAQKE